LLGGTTFIAGTGVLYLVQTPNLAALSAFLYTLGSLGFLLVDVLEFFTFRDPLVLRANISLSALGSTLYVIGSIGFFPSLYSASSIAGIWGFILGSLFIGVSQLCKLVRIGWREGEGFSFSSLLSTPDSMSACGVEGGAAVGAWFFFSGTLLLLLNASAFTLVLLLWVLGSLAFTLGGISLAARHFILNLT